MAGLTTYNSSLRQLSASVGFAILQAGVQGFLTNGNVTGAATAQDLIDFVNAAVVAPGAEAGAQRINITKALERGKAMGDLSDSRIAAATSLSDLAQTYTWVDQYPASANGQLGVGIYG